jgi:cytochrome d ubiquinol oxidase subunit II
MMNLPLIWAGLIAFIILMYVVLDGFDLGIGILYPFIKDHRERDLMMHTMSPIWDGNETWMVLGAACLYGAFPLVYSTVLPTLYLPLFLMLAALIFRGVSLEFRFKSHSDTRYLWDLAFSLGSIFAAFCQGLILGTFVQGHSFAGEVPYSWLTPFTVFTGISVVIGYALLGAGWLIARTEKDLQNKMYKAATILLSLLSICLLVVSLWTPFISEFVMHRWFDLSHLLYLSPFPIVTGLCILAAFYSLYKRKEWLPFLLSIGVFICAYAGFVISIWPYILPYHVTVWEAAAPHNTLVFLGVGIAILLPVLLAYNAYAYYVFRGKTQATDEHY